MIIENLSISGLYLLKPEIIEDERGFFFREFCQQELIKQGINIGQIVQCNRSFNKEKGTFRGLHYQIPPFSEEKVVTCLRGKIADVIVDLRKGSSTFMQNAIIELSQKNNYSLLIPKGCAHGFVTIEENTELHYMHTNVYSPLNERACSVFDPLLNLTLPIEIGEVSERDRSHQFLKGNFEGITV